MALAIFVGYLFHSSVMILVVGVIGAITLVKTTKKALIVWFAAIIISLIFGNALADYISQFATNDDRAQRYLQYAQDSELMEGFSHIGFRWDFLLFSALPIGIGYYVTVVRGIKDRFYQFMLNSYILANALWVIFIYAAFNNRYATLSWCLYPYLLYYPFAKFRLDNVCKQNKCAVILLWMMLGFSAYI